MPESVLLTFTLEQDAGGTWRAWLHAPGCTPEPITGLWNTREQAYHALVVALTNRHRP
jgi:hypothetical protein